MTKKDLSNEGLNIKSYHQLQKPTREAYVSDNVLLPGVLGVPNDFKILFVGSDGQEQKPNKSTSVQASPQIEIQPPQQRPKKFQRLVVQLNNHRSSKKLISLRDSLRRSPLSPGSPTGQSSDDLVRMKSIDESEFTLKGQKIQGKQQGFGYYMNI